MSAPDIPNIQSRTDFPEVTMSTLDQQCLQEWRRLYEKTHSGANWVIWRWTAQGTLIYQCAKVFLEDAQDELRRVERRHPSRIYFLWEVPQD